MVTKSPASLLGVDAAYHDVNNTVRRALCSYTDISFTHLKIEKRFDFDPKVDELALKSAVADLEGIYDVEFHISVSDVRTASHIAEKINVALKNKLRARLLPKLASCYEAETGKPAGSLSLDMSFYQDLDVDSLTMCYINDRLQDKHEIFVNEAEFCQCRTVSDAIDKMMQNLLAV